MLCISGTAADLSEGKGLIASALLPVRRGWTWAGLDLCSQFLYPQGYRQILRILRCRDCERVLVFLG